MLLAMNILVSMFSEEIWHQELKGNIQKRQHGRKKISNVTSVTE